MLNDAWAYRLGWIIMHSLWEGAAIAAAAAMVRLALPPRAAQARYLVLTAALLAMVGGAVITFLISPTAVPLSGGAAAAAHQLDPSFEAAAGVSAVLPPLGAPPREAPAGAPAPTSRLTRLWASLADGLSRALPSVANAWIACVLLLAVWRAASWLAAQRLRLLATQPADAQLSRLAQRLAQQLNLTVRFDVLLSHLAQTVVVIGWMRPVILIPVAVVAGLTPRQLEAILAHELAHIRRRDYLVNLVQILVETLLFYHPAVWWISRQIRLEREQACDDVAISLCGNAREYARSLAALEELRLFGSPALAAGGAGGRQLLARIRRILVPNDHAGGWGWSVGIAFLVIAGGAAVMYSQPGGKPAGADSPRQNGAITSTQPFVLHNDAPRLSPFTAVRWRGEIPEVRYEGQWYELMALDDVPAARILDYLKQSQDFAPQKHFAEDLVEVMRDFGHPLDRMVKLDLKSLDDGKAITIAAAAMTEANRQSVLANGPAPTAPLGGRSGAPRGMPFSAVRWHGQTPEIFVAGKWYELIAINDLPALQIVGFAQGWAGRGDWQRRFAEDLPDILAAMGQPAGPVNIAVRTLDTHESSTLKNVAMNPDNRVLNMFGMSPSDPAFGNALRAGTQSLFSRARWKNDTAQVQVNGNDTWYDLLGIDSLTTAQIYESAVKTYGDQWRQHIAENSVQMIKALGDTNDNVLLQLHTLNTDENVQVLKRLWPARN
jgi:beta-lactamase regulating signal transducer with metallopeptidase domain